MGGDKTLRLYSLGIGFRDGLHLMAWNGRRRQNVTLTLWFFYPLDGSGTRDLSAGIHTTIAMRQAAKQRANVILMNAFGNSPAWW